MPLTHGVDEVEAIVVADALRRAGITTVTASVDATNPLVGQGRFRLMADVDFQDALLEWGDAFDAIVLPGGELGTLTFERSLALTSLVARRRAAGAIVVGLGTSSRLVPAAADGSEAPVQVPVGLSRTAYADALVLPIVTQLRGSVHSSR